MDFNGKDFKLINLYGAEFVEYIFYIGNMLSLSGKKVLFIDNTTEQWIFSYLPVINNQNLIRYRGCYYISRAKLDKKLFSRFDLILSVNGETYEVSQEIHGEKTYIIVKPDRITIKKVRNIIKNLQKNYALIYLNVFEEDYASIDFDIGLDFSKQYKRFFLSSEDKRHRKMPMEAEKQGYFYFNNLSQKTIFALMQIVNDLCDSCNKEAELEITYTHNIYALE